MKIGIIIHSKTGTTLKFAKLIARKLLSKGQTVDLTVLATDIPVNVASMKQEAKFTITNLPDCGKYDAIIIGGPVWGFSASPVIMECLRKIDSVSGKKVLPLVTMGLTFPGMGGKQAIKQMSTEASGKGGVVLPGKIIPKLFRRQNYLMEIASTQILSEL